MQRQERGRKEPSEFNCRAEIEKHVAAIGLSLNNKTNIYPLRNGVDFLGFHTYLTETGAVIRKVRRRSKNNMKRKLKKMRGLVERGKITTATVEQSYKAGEDTPKREIVIT